MARQVKAVAKSSRPANSEKYAAADRQLQTHADTIYGDPEYTPGMNTSNHNASWKRREEEVCLNFVKNILCEGDQTQKWTDFS